MRRHREGVSTGATATDYDPPITATTIRKYEDATGVNVAVEWVDPEEWKKHHKNLSKDKKK